MSNPNGTELDDLLKHPQAKEGLEKLQEAIAEMKQPQKGNGNFGENNEFLVPEQLLHLYQKAKVTEEREYVVEIEEFKTVSGTWGGFGRKTGKDGDPEDKRHWINLGNILTEEVNGPGQWGLASLMPNGAGQGAALLKRRIAYPLPFPELLETTTEVRPATGEELESYARRAQEWANGGAGTESEGQAS